MLLLAAATLLLAAPRVSAQSVTLDQYRAAETAEDGFALSRPDDLGHLRWGVRLDFDYALNPLVVEGVEGDPDSERGAIVEHMLVAQLVGALGLIDRLVVFVGLPVNLMMVGQEFPGFPAADGTSLGDLFLGLRARIVGERGDLFALGAQVTLTTPTAAAAQDGELLAGEGSLSGWLKILAELRWDFLRVTANVGARFRKDADFRSVAVSHSLAVSHEFTWALGLTIPAVRDRLDVYAEAYGATTFDSFADREVSPVELIAGLKVWAVDGLNVGLAAGPGLARGYGAPDLRFILTFAYAVPVEQPTGAAGRKDSDDDGLYDDEDDCPDDPEDFDEFQDGDGCPDPDNDGDTIVDDDDSCPLVAEDLDGFDDEDGCPDLDNDNDMVPDEIDNCPLEAEDDDDYEDEDGCPDPDNDADTVLDRDDNCPLDPGRPEEQGCPRTIVVDRGVGEIRILERVEFETNEDIVLDRSIPVLEEVRGALASNVAIRRVRVEGHTDDRGSDEHNMDLSRRRAQAVVRWLTEHGLPAPRLEAWGCGETVPVESNATSTGRQTNRRVEFHIVDPGAPGAAGPEATCQRAE